MHKDDLNKLKSHPGVLRLYGSRLQGMHRSGKDFIAHCPFHADKNPSFRINMHDGIWMWSCFPCQGRGEKAAGSIIEFVAQKDDIQANESIRRVAQELGISNEDSSSELEEPPSPPEPPFTEQSFEYDPERATKRLPQIKDFLSKRGISMEVARKYGLGAVNLPGRGLSVAIPYENGGVKFRVTEPGDKGSRFTQRQGHSTADSLYGVEKVDVFDYLRDDRIIVTESELDALTLVSHGYNAVSVSSAASIRNKDGLKIRGDHLADLGLAAHIFLALDADREGQRCADAFQRELPSNKTHRITWDYVKNVRGPKDVGEIYSEDPDSFRERFETLITEAKQFRTVNGFRYEICSLPDFLKKPITPPKQLLGPVIREKDLNEIYATRGLGKTYVGLGIGLALASGLPFLKWKVEAPQRVLYVDAEMSGHDFQSRLRAMSKGLGPNVDLSRFYPMNFDSQSSGAAPDIAKSEGREVIDDMLDTTSANVLILDNLSCLAMISDNDDEAWLPINSWLLSLRRRGVTAILVHHSGKNGDQRGISRREDPLNTVIQLRKPADWRPDEGMHCNLTFKKNRSFYGQDAEPLDIRLTDAENGGLVWKWNSQNKGNQERFREMVKAKTPKKVIMDELGISQATYYRWLKEYTEEDAEYIFPPEEDF